MADDTIYNDPDKLNTTRSGWSDIVRVEKPWGHEQLLVRTPRYVMKILTVNPGQRLSLQYHNRKMETLYFEQGKGILTISEEGDLENIANQDIKAGGVLHINPRTVHTFEAKTQLRIIEVSTPEIDDVVRLEDRYGRAGK